MKDAVAKIMDEVVDELVITSVGTISREVFAYRDRPQNLYLMGAMGCALGVGIGLALNTGKKVMVIAGDGEILMSAGTLILMHSLHLSNLKLYVIDNNSYAMTGCQKTCSDDAVFEMIVPHLIKDVKPKKTDAPRITMIPKEIRERFYNAVNSM